jgi:hypothetical protein
MNITAEELAIDSHNKLIAILFADLTKTDLKFDRQLYIQAVEFEIMLSFHY